MSIKIFKFDHSNKSYRAVLSCGAVYYAVRGGCNLRVRKWYPLLALIVTEEESWWAELSCGTVYYDVQVWGGSNFSKYVAKPGIQKEGIKKYFAITLFLFIALQNVSLFVPGQSWLWKG